MIGHLELPEIPRESLPSQGAKRRGGGIRIKAVAGAYTSKGPRAKNDDRYALASEGAWAISDGIGGAPFGDAAAHIAVTTAVRDFSNGHGIDHAFSAASAAVRSFIELIGEEIGAGCTLLLCEQQGNGLSFSWVGDSVAFLCRGYSARKLTVPDRAEGNALGSCLGYDDAIPLDAHTETLREGDAVILCTDGVWEPFEGREARLAEIVVSEAGSQRTEENATRAAHAIVLEALRGGHDNATAVVILIDKEEGRLLDDPLDYLRYGDLDIDD